MVKKPQMAKNRQNRAFYAKKNQLFDYFIGKLRDSIVSENFGHFWTRGGHFEFSRYQFEGFPVLESKSLFRKSCS